MRSSKTGSEGENLTTETERHRLKTIRDKLCLSVSVVNPHLLYIQLQTATGLRRRLRMALFIQQSLVCAASLLLALACARVEPAANSSHGAAAAPPDAPLLSAAEPITLSPEDQTEDALNNVRRADETARAGGGAVPQLTPSEHMRRAAIYHSNRAFEEARAHWRALIERYPAD